MRPVFVGNLDYDTRHSELDRLFYRYGRIDRIDMKSGFAFVYFEDERDGDEAIRALDGYPFGPGRRRLSVEWSRGDRGSRRDGYSKPPMNTKPTKTLFVINFDPINTRVTDIERHFEPFGKLSNVRIRRNFAFVQFETQEEATKALEATHSTFLVQVTTYGSRNVSWWGLHGSCLDTVMVVALKFHANHPMGILSSSFDIVGRECCWTHAMVAQNAGEDYGRRPPWRVGRLPLEPMGGKEEVA